MSWAGVGGVVAGVVAVVVLAVLFFWQPGWLRRSAAGGQLGELATPPTIPRPLRATSEGRYGGTRRVADGTAVRSHGLGGKGRVLLVLTAEGLVLQRHGLDDLLIEEHELGGATQRGNGLAVWWWHGDVQLETVVELASADDVAGWVTSLEQLGR